MSKTNESTDFYERFKIPSIIVDNENIIDLDNPTNDEEIMNLINTAYEVADKKINTGQRSPVDVKIVEKKRKELEKTRSITEEEERQNKMNRESWEAYAARIQERNRDSVKEDLSIRMTRLKEALKDPEIKDILLKVMNRTISKEQAFYDIKDLNTQQAFNDIKANPSLKKQMMSLTLKGPANTGGKSRVFRRKNKKTTSTSRRNARRTQRRRKSSTRRSTRK
jgi:hypothetical protein